MSEAHAPVPPPLPLPPAPPGGAAAPPEEDLPRRFGKYTLIRKLAVGGMAELYLALQRSVAGFEKLVVVKRVLPRLVADKGFIEMLLDEARIAATLNHPNVAHIYDVGVWEGQYYIAMEHIHGEDLRSIVRQMKNKAVTSFPLEHALAIVLGCCKGLVYAHEKRDLDGELMNIVHRDVSPQNILCTFNGDVKLVDFGIAKAGRSTNEETKSGQLKGKVPYMSPEQAQGLDLDARSDLFSLGVILFELTTGRRLFRGPNELETLKRIVEGSYPAPRSLNPNLSPRLEQIILRALAKNVAERYQAARQMQAELEAYIRDEQLAVSAISLGEWMQSLFAEKLTQQKQMLQEGRQLAEVLAAQAAEEETATHGSLASGVRVKPSRVPLLIGIVLFLAALAAFAVVIFRPPGDPPGPARGPGVIEMTSEPPGAAIWLDGDRRSERTPAKITQLPVGATYTVKLTADGYEPHTQRIELTTARPHATLAAQLARPSAASFGIVNVRTTPAGASVLFDGRATGLTTPATIPEIAPGVDHSVVLTLPDYVTKSVPINLRAGQVEDLYFQLEATPLGPEEAIVRITTDPENARVQFRDQWHDSGSPYEFRVEATHYRVTVARPGFESREERIELPGGQTTEITIALQRERRPDPGPNKRPDPPDRDPPPTGGPGQLTVDARPWCNISVGGRNLGQTPVVGVTLPAGRHTVTCVNPEMNIRRTVTVDIEPGQTTRRLIRLE